MNRHSQNLALALRGIMVLVFVPAAACPSLAAPPPTFVRQELRVEGGGRGGSRWQPFEADLNGDRLKDMVLITEGGRVYVFLQQAKGFLPSPDHSWRLPAETVWVDIVRFEGRDTITISTVRGLAIYRFVDGRFETEPTDLLESPQAFAGATMQRASTGSDFHWRLRWPEGLPLIFEDHMQYWRFAPVGPPAPGKRFDLKPRRQLESTPPLAVGRQRWRGGHWSVAGQSSYWICSKTMALADGANVDEGVLPEGPRRQREAFHEAHKGRGDVEYQHIDLDGDERNDIIVRWDAMGIEPEVTFAVFLGRPDKTWLAEPDQVLRCKGFAAGWWPYKPITQDKRRDLVMVELNTVNISVHQALERLVSGQMDCRISVRPFEGRGFAKRPAFTLKTTMTTTRWYGAFNLDGDYNGDNRQDLLVWQSPTSAVVFLSQDNRWEKEPSLRFEAPEFCDPNPTDINGDGLTDLVLSRGDTIVLYLSRRGGQR